MRIKLSSVEIVSDLCSADNSHGVIENIPHVLVSPKRIHTSRASSSTSTIPSAEKTPPKPDHLPHRTKQSRQPSKLERILTLLKSHPRQNLSLPSSPVAPASPEHIAKTQIKHGLSDQTAILLHSMTRPSMLSYNQPLPNPCNQFQLTQNAPKDERLQQNRRPYRQRVSSRYSQEPSPPRPQISFKSEETQPATRPETLLRKLSDAFRRRDVERYSNSTLIMHGNDEEEILDATQYNNGRNKHLQSSPSGKGLSDSSSTTFTQNFEDTRPHHTLSSGSSDLYRVERDESYSAAPGQLKRTYTSSEDSYRGVEIETLSSATVDEVSITNYSTTEDSLITSSTSSSYTISEDSHTAYELSVTIPELDGTEYEAESVSSTDADHAWREQFIPPLPPIIGRTYSSSASEQSCETFDETLVSSFRDEVAVNSGRSAWTSEEVSEILSSQGPSHSQRGYIQSDPTWLEDSNEVPGSNGFETMQSLPNLGISSQLMTHANDVGKQYVKSKKPHILKKAARLLSQIFGYKSSRSPDRSLSETQTQTQTRRKSFSSLFWGRCT